MLSPLLSRAGNLMEMNTKRRRFGWCEASFAGLPVPLVGQAILIQGIEIAAELRHVGREARRWQWQADGDDQASLVAGRSFGQEVADNLIRNPGAAWYFQQTNNLMRNNVHRFHPWRTAAEMLAILTTHAVRIEPVVRCGKTPQTAPRNV